MGQVIGGLEILSPEEVEKDGFLVFMWYLMMNKYPCIKEFQVLIASSRAQDPFNQKNSKTLKVYAM
jgi:hypothetical protein